MNESALLQLVSWGGILLGPVIAGLTYRAITIELKRPEPDGSLTSGLWVVVAAGLGLALIGGWAQVIMRSRDPGPTKPAPLGVADAVPTASASQAVAKGLDGPPSSVSQDAELVALKAKLAKLEANLAKYRGLQTAFAQNREKWQDVLDKAGVIAGQLRPDVQSELKAIRDQLGVKLVEEDP